MTGHTGTHNHDGCYFAAAVALDHPARCEWCVSRFCPRALTCKLASWHLNRRSSGSAGWVGGGACDMHFAQVGKCSR